MDVEESDILAVEFKCPDQRQAGVFERTVQFLVANGGDGRFQRYPIRIVEIYAANVAA